MKRKQSQDGQGETSYPNQGYSVIKPSWQYHMSWQAALGLSLIKAVREAEETSTVHTFVPVDIPVTPPTVTQVKELNPDWVEFEDLFRLKRAEARRRNVGKMQRR